MIFYINKTVNGGALRVYVPEKAVPFTNNNCGYIDIEPLFGRLVVFRRYESYIMRYCQLLMNNIMLTFIRVSQ